MSYLGLSLLYFQKENTSIIIGVRLNVKRYNQNLFRRHLAETSGQREKLHRVSDQFVILCNQLRFDFWLHSLSKQENY